MYKSSEDDYEITRLIRTGVFEMTARIGSKVQPLEYESIEMLNKISVLFTKNGDNVVKMLNELCNQTEYLFDKQKSTN